MRWREPTITVTVPPVKGIPIIVVALAALGCAPTEEPGFTSVGSDAETGETDSGETGAWPPGLQMCGDPEFEGQLPEDPAISECVGQGGGALVFDVFSGFGNGVIRDKSKASPTVFFSDDPNDVAVGACCGAAAFPEDVTGACESDCARTACNTAIAALEAAVAEPSSLEGNGCGKNCAVNVATSMEEWILPQLKSRVGYEDCLAMANLNHDASVDYTAAEFVDEQLFFQRPNDACMDFGCISNVRLRVYCAVDSAVATDQMCSMATNDEHPDIPESDQFIVDAAPTQVTSVSNGHAEAFLAKSHGGLLRQDACNESPCPFVLETFSLSTDEAVDIGPLRAWNLTAALEYAAVGTRVGDTVVFDAGALRFRISGVASRRIEDGNGHGNGVESELPLEFVIANTSPAMATFTGAIFSLDEIEFRQGEYELRLRVHAAPAGVVE